MSKPLTIRISDGLNIFSSQPRPRPLDNRTIQSFVKDYVHEYVGKFTVASHITVLFGCVLSRVSCV